MLAKKMVGTALCLGILTGGGTLVGNIPVQADTLYAQNYSLRSAQEIVQEAKIIFPYVQQEGGKFKVLCENARQNGVPESVIQDTTIKFQYLNSAPGMAYLPKKIGRSGFVAHVELPLLKDISALYLNSYEASLVHAALTEFGYGIGTASAVAAILSSIGVPAENFNNLVTGTLQIAYPMHGESSSVETLYRYNLAGSGGVILFYTQKLQFNGLQPQRN